MTNFAGSKIEWRIASQTNSTGSNFQQPWAARRARPMDGWSNGELQEVIRNGRMPVIQSIAMCFYSNATRDRVRL